jgi:hypothetical protein
VNNKLFNTWTKESAYFLGVVSVLGDAEGITLTVEAPSADRNWLHMVASLLGLKRLSPSGTFSVQNRKLMDPLWAMKAKYGTLVDAVPDDLFHHFVRGILDAGGVASAKIVVLTGKIGALRKVRDRLKELLKLSDLSSIDSEPDSLPALTYTNSDVPKLAEFLYKESEGLCSPTRQAGFSTENTDEPCEQRRARSQGSGCSGESRPVLRPRTRSRSDFNPMVW